MITAEPKTLSRQLSRVLDEVQIAEDLTTATVGHREIQADNSRELQRLLAAALYEVLHAGFDADRGPVPFHIRDSRFEKRLTEAVPHRNTRTIGKVRSLPLVEGGPVLLEREGVLVWTPAERIHDHEVLTVGKEVEVEVNAIRPALSPGFFLVDGSRPATVRSDVLRVYVHLTNPDDAAPAWGTTLRHLEENGARYRAKVLSAPTLYPRRDALVIYLRQGSWELADGLAGALHGLPGLAPDVSLFARPLAAGVAAAWEPDDRRAYMRGMSFGQHRAGVIAQALIDHKKGLGALPQTLAERMREARIRLDDLASNTDSPALLA
ncbi:T3SS effector HopA1 family protein [Streptomyces sp. IBSBF 2806]|uniref:T3SS effector HopA1 family protein n=1 Tax=Streptomyces sp. IBSBF 2806 TaxID=2903529 RepID=UPI002FDBB924